MPTLAGSELAQTRSQLAVAVRSKDSLRIADARREFAAAKLAAVVEEVVAKAPPLTPEQRDRISALLGGASA